MISSAYDEKGCLEYTFVNLLQLALLDVDQVLDLIYRLRLRYDHY